MGVKSLEGGNHEAAAGESVWRDYCLFASLMVIFAVFLTGVITLSLSIPTIQFVNVNKCISMILSSEISFFSTKTEND